MQAQFFEMDGWYCQSGNTIYPYVRNAGLVLRRLGYEQADGDLNLRVELSDQFIGAVPYMHTRIEPTDNAILALDNLGDQIYVKPVEGARRLSVVVIFGINTRTELNLYECFAAVFETTALEKDSAYLITPRTHFTTLKHFVESEGQIVKKHSSLPLPNPYPSLEV